MPSIKNNPPSSYQIVKLAKQMMANGQAENFQQAKDMAKLSLSLSSVDEIFSAPTPAFIMSVNPPMSVEPQLTTQEKELLAAGTQNSSSDYSKSQYDSALMKLDAIQKAAAKKKMPIPSKPQFKSDHQVAVFVDMTKRACSSDAFRERANRLIVGSVNLPNTMKSDVFGITDVITEQFQPGQPISFDVVSAPDVQVNDALAAELAESLGYVSYMVIRSTNNKQKVKN